MAGQNDESDTTRIRLAGQTRFTTGVGPGAGQTTRFPVFQAVDKEPTLPKVRLSAAALTTSGKGL
jgi:hypothetical protein